MRFVIKAARAILLLIACLALSGCLGRGAISTAGTVTGAAVRTTGNVVGTAVEVVTRDVYSIHLERLHYD